MTNNRINRTLTGMGILSFVVCLIIGMVLVARVYAGFSEGAENFGNDGTIRMALGVIAGSVALVACVYLWDRVRYSELYLESQRSRALMNASSSLIFTYDARTKNVIWLGDAEHVFQVKKRKLTLEELVHPEDWPFVKQQMEDLRWGREYSVHIRILDGEGQYCPCNCRMTAVKNNIGRITDTMGIIQPGD